MITSPSTNDSTMNIAGFRWNLCSSKPLHPIEEISTWTLFRQTLLQCLAFAMEMELLPMEVSLTSMGKCSNSLAFATSLTHGSQLWPAARSSSDTSPAWLPWVKVQNLRERQLLPMEVSLTSMGKSSIYVDFPWSQHRARMIRQWTWLDSVEISIARNL